MSLVPITRRNGGQVAERQGHPLDRMRGRFDTLFDNLWSSWLAPFDQDLESLRVWDFNVKENDREITIRAEMPGFDEKDLDVQFNNDVLTIKAEKEQKGDQQEEFRSFYRSIALPAGIKAEGVQATYRNGVLELHMPKAEETQPKRIKVQGEPALPHKDMSSSQAANQAQDASKQAASTASGKAAK